MNDWPTWLVLGVVLGASIATYYLMVWIGRLLDSLDLAIQKTYQTTKLKLRENKSIIAKALILCVVAGALLIAANFAIYKVTCYGTQCTKYNRITNSIEIYRSE